MRTTLLLSSFLSWIDGSGSDAAGMYTGKGMYFFFTSFASVDCRFDFLSNLVFCRLGLVTGCSVSLGPVVARNSARLAVEKYLSFL